MSSRLVAVEGNARRILDVVQRHPGIGLNEACRMSGLARGTTTHHLGRLIRGRFVRCERDGKFLRHYAEAT